jgi:hypothetical protein
VARTKKHKTSKKSGFEAWKLVMLLIVSLFMLATFLRMNNIAMTQRLRAVIAADEAGDEVQLNQRLLDLQRFVFSHVMLSIDQSGGQTAIYFGTGPFYLQGQYQRDAQAVIERAREAAATDPGENIYRLVADICDPLARQFGWGYSQPYFDCIARELARFGAASEEPVHIVMPNVALYRHNYESPRWAMDFVGLMMIVCAVLAVMLLIKLLVYLVLRVILWNYRKTAKRR